ncbi:MAG TPA: RDD family protein, partial [Solirubrobacteraceae bacterium]|nr:RDD family protein [Solirubrobacteraceae bacterium]
MELEDRTRVGTPEGLELEIPLAGFASRFIARCFDIGVQIFILIALLVVIVVLELSGGEAGRVGVGGGTGGGGGLAVAVFSIVAFAVSYLYNVLFEVLGQGRTPGKRMTHLRVVREGATPVDLPASLIRNLLRLLDELLFGLPALVSILLTKQNQRLGDLAAG